MEKEKINQLQVFGYFYFGAIVVGLSGFLLFGDRSKIPSLDMYSTQWMVLIYLGVIASGVSYFWWNKGVCKCDSGVVSIMNNLVIPLAVIVEWIFFSHTLSNSSIFGLFFGGSIIIIALMLHYRIMRFYAKGYRE